MKKLREFLRLFNRAQIQAFVDHEPKDPNDSVTDDRLHWGFINIQALEVHLEDEIREFQENDDMDSLVDLANMCFLVWTVRGIRAVRRPPR